MELKNTTKWSKKDKVDYYKNNMSQENHENETMEKLQKYIDENDCKELESRQLKTAYNILKF